MAEVCRKRNIEQVDIFKIDAEGAELDILKGIPQNLIDNASALIGELHGVNDFEFLERLSKSHNVGVAKRYNCNCYPFVAVSKPNQATIRLA